MSDKENSRDAIDAMHSRVAAMEHALKGNTDGLHMDDVLELKKLTCIEVLLSWGGPSEWIRAILNEEGIQEASFHYAHWFFVTEVPLDHNQQKIVEQWLVRTIIPYLQY